MLELGLRLSGLRTEGHVRPAPLGQEVAVLPELDVPLARDLAETLVERHAPRLSQRQSLDRSRRSGPTSRLEADGCLVSRLRDPFGFVPGHCGSP